LLGFPAVQIKEDGAALWQRKRRDACSRGERGNKVLPCDADAAGPLVACVRVLASHQPAS
jgi:hypothetical protein